MKQKYHSTLSWDFIHTKHNGWRVHNRCNLVPTNPSNHEFYNIPFSHTCARLHFSLLTAISQARKKPHSSSSSAFNHVWLRLCCQFVWCGWWIGASGRGRQPAPTASPVSGCLPPPPKIAAICIRVSSRIVGRSAGCGWTFANLHHTRTPPCPPCPFS